jgi:hypothetical protein
MNLIILDGDDDLKEELIIISRNMVDIYPAPD